MGEGRFNRVGLLSLKNQYKMNPETAGVVNSILNIVSIIVTALMAVYVAKSYRKMDAVKNEVQMIIPKVDVVENKLDENHKQQNGNLAILLETTKKLATAQEKARGEAENKGKK